ncbi:hypothetical protein DUNSADRAFT_7910 [Dunaliella salina]|uniref:Uncharacterized protein n=1 Tax=Dunaliella salina TaxID=3046 RepID=A0ABQ7FT14_DUNSA|nr:hypothetical protein DUNSADRAFT_7910 [Dunaliella salina]|eukprot:KAF5825636.1 hypothetical protein DUNSADRAFT_7910 [Dunaliella salina]
MSFCKRFECKHTCWDPKDGELCLSRVKPVETLVEARRCADASAIIQGLFAIIQGHSTEGSVQ